MTLLYWLTSVFSLLGVALNIRRHVACFWIWTGTNAVWTFADFSHGLYPQAALMAVYCALSVYGIWSWTRQARSLASDTPRKE
jgi:nicotinamide mononucleotide transporter